MTCFYVGKGKGRRYKTKSRNSHHDNIINKYGYITKIIKENLTEQEALDLEKERIHYYVFDLDYGIDIDGYRKYNNNQFLTNLTFGGEGNYGVPHTEKWKQEHSKRMTGSGNPMYGVNVFDNLSNQEQNRLRKLHSDLSSGENNPMFGISPQERMTDEVYKQWLLKMKKRNFNGVNNPNYNNKTLHNKIKDNKELRIKYYSRPKEQNGRAREIYVYDLYGLLVKKFSYIGECAEWLKDFLGLTTKVSSIRCSIITSIKNNKPYQKYIFSYDEL